MATNNSQLLNLQTSATFAATDADNNTYLMGNMKGQTFDFGGTSLTFGESTGVWLAKYDHDGALVWARQWNSLKANSAYGDGARGLAVDSDGNVYVSMNVMGGGNGGSSGVGNDTLDLDPGAGVYNVTTTSFNSAAAFVKLDSEGNFQWAKNTGVSGGAGRITVDTNDNVYVTGTFRDGASIGGTAMQSGGAGTHHFIAKFNQGGTVQWTKTAYAGNDVNGINDISVNASGEVFLAGYNGSSLTIDGVAYTTNWGQNADYDGLLWKLKTDGTTDYVRKIAGSLNERYTDVVPLEDGSVILAGSYNSGTDLDPSAGTTTPANAGGTDLFVARVGADGSLLWHFTGGGTGADVAKRMFVDTDGSVLVSGTFAGTATIGGQVLTSAGGVDAYVLKLDTSGQCQWVKTIGSAFADDIVDIVPLSGGAYKVVASIRTTTDVDPGPGVVNAVTPADNTVAMAVVTWNADGAITTTPAPAGANTAPVLADTSLSFPAIAEDAPAPSGAVGFLVSGIVEVGGNVQDIDAGAVTGVAIVGADTVHGSWYYSTNNGATWKPFGTVSPGAALLLRPEDRIYFQPGADYAGTVSSGITIRAWDQTGASSGAQGTKVDVGNNGGATAFSATSDTVSIKVNAVNDAPRVNNLDGDASDFTPGVAQYIDAQPDIGDAATVSDDNPDFGGGYLRITQTGGKADGVFSFDASVIKAGTDEGSADAVIAAGEKVFVDDGTSWIDVGSVDSLEDGQAGRALKIHFNDAALNGNPNAGQMNAAAALLGYTQYTADTVGTRTFNLMLNDGALSSPAVAFGMRGLGVTGVSSGNVDRAYKVGDVISIDVSFSGTVSVTGGTPTLELGTGQGGATATWNGVGGTNKLTFTYQVRPGDDTSDLDYVSASSLKLNGASITNDGDVVASVVLPAPGQPGSLGVSKTIILDGNAPTDIALDGGAVSTSAAANAVVGALSTTDSTTGDIFTYALVGGAGDTNNGAFAISGGNLVAIDPASLTPGANSVRVRTTDAAGNSYEEALNISVTTNPTVTVSADKTVLKAGEKAIVTFAFSEAPTAFDADDVTVTGSTGVLGDVTVDSVDNKIYHATFTPTAGTQAVSAAFSVAAGVITDASNQANLASNTLVVTGDTALPTVASILRHAPAAGVTNADALVYRVTFSEAVTGVDSADFSVSGAGLTASITGLVTVDGKTYDITVSGGNLASFNGDVTLAFAPGQTITDAVGNPLAATGPTGIDQPSYTLDNTVVAPTVTLANDTANGTDGITGDGTVNVALASDVASWAYSTNNGGTWTTGSGTSFTLAPAVYSAGQVQVRQTDIAGNQSAAGFLAAVTVDTSVAAPAMLLASDTGSNPADGVTSNGTVNVTLAPDAASWEYRIGDGAWTSGQGASFTLEAGSYAANGVRVRQTDVAGNVSAETVNAGALVIDTGNPTVSGILRPTLSQPAGSGSFTIGITYADSGAGLDVSTLSSADITVTGPGSVGALAVSGVTYDVASKTASYTVAAPAGGWNPVSHAGSYTIGVAGGEVKDLAGNGVAANAAAYSFDVSYNANPAITSNGGGAAATIDLAERKTAITTVTAADSDQDAVSYSISGGADQARFHIDATTGALTFLAAPSFASPADSDGDNSYLVEVSAADGKGGVDVQALTVKVLADLDGDGTEDVADDDIDDDGRPNTVEDLAPGANGVTGDGNGDGIADSRQINVASLPTAVAGNPYATLEVGNGLTLTQVSATAAPGGLPRNVKLPLGQFDFTIGKVTPGATVEMSIYVDASLKVNGYFKQDNTGKWASIAKSVTTVGSKTKITFELTDGGIYDSDGQVNGSIVDPGGVALIAPLIFTNGGGATAMVNVAEMTKAVTTVSASAVSTVSYSISGGADAALFSIDAHTGALRFVDAPDYGKPRDVGDTAGNNTYVVNVTATAGGETDTQVLTVKVSAVAEAPPVTPPKTATVDGVTVSTGTVTNGDGSTSQVVTIPVVLPTRTEQVGNNSVADIPLVKMANGESVLSAQVPTGLGLTVTGNAAPKPVGASVADLIREIKAHTDAGSHDQNTLTGGGSGFLADLAADAPLLVQTIVPTSASGAAASEEALVITGTPQNAGSPLTALVIDSRALPSGSVIQLHHVEFAAVIGAVTVTGGDGAQNVWGDGASQTIMLGADDDILHGGAGDDTVGSAGGNDQIFGDEGDDMVFGGEGNDAIDGGTGIDTVRLVGAGRSDYTMRVENGKLTLVHRDGGIDGADTVANVEKLNFTGGDPDLTARGVITRMVDAVSDRTPDRHELAHWMDMHAAGMSMHDIASELVASQAQPGAQDSAAFVDSLYQHALGREADVAGRTHWIGVLEQGKADRADVMSVFANSAEKLALEKANGHTLDFNQTDVATLVRMYDTLFDRKADAGGLNYWIGASESGMGLRDIANGFIHGEESGLKFSAMSNIQFVEYLYKIGLDREGRAEEVKEWVSQLDRGAISRADALLGFADSAEKIALVGVMSTSIETI